MTEQSSLETNLGYGNGRQHAVHPDAFDTFNKADIDGLSKVMADDAVQHRHGSNQFAGDHQGRDNILSLYGKIGEVSGGTFQAVLTDAKDGGPNKVVAQYDGQAARDGKTLESENTIDFTLREGKIVDIDDRPSDVAAWDAFWG